MFLLPLLLVSINITSFAFDLSKPLQSKKENAVYSPLSISTTLSMCAVGSKEVTYQEIEKALHFDGSEQILADQFKILLTDLKEKSDKSPNLTLNLDAVLCLEKEFQFLPLYQSNVVNHFFGELKSIDFKKPKIAVFEINEWFFEKTNGLMGPLLNLNDVDKSTKLIVLSTLYMKAFFEKPFKSFQTNSKLFHVNHDKDILIDLMQQIDQFPYFKGSDFEVVELSYLPLDQQIVLWIILPQSIDDFNFNEDQFNKILSSLKPQLIDLKIPRFRIESTMNLIPVLKQLGIKQAFTTKANFSLMSDENDLMISDFKHKALMIVDEGGTTATAATSATLKMKSSAPAQNKISFIADRPFLFMILDKKNQIPLFMGQVVEPQSVNFYIDPIESSFEGL